MASKINRLSPGAYRRGGYTGGKPASKVNPPVKVPSESMKSESNGEGSSGKK